jgi:hypothetical protein
MKTFTIKCVSMKDFCESVGINYDDAIDAVSNSDVSFGTNDDTLVTVSNLCNILEMHVPAGIDPKLFVSLGC